jgi:hypothetical protein
VASHRIIDEQPQRSCPGGDVPRRNQEPISFVTDDARVAWNTRCDNREATGHCFEEDDPKAFLAGAWSAEHVSGGIAAGKPFGFDEPGERYAGNMIVSNEPLAPAAHGAIADDHQTNVVAHLTKPGERLQEVQNTLRAHSSPVGRAWDADLDPRLDRRLAQLDMPFVRRDE